MEWHFADFGTLAKQGKKFDCNACPKDIQKIRRCHEDNWEHQMDSIFPIKLLEHSQGQSFCPTKLFRDDPEFCITLRNYYIAWRLGQVPTGGTIGSMIESDLEVLMLLIVDWEHYEKMENFQRLGYLLGGKKE